MRRPAAALLGTVVGTVLLVGAKYGAAPAGTDATNSVAAGDADPGGTVAADPPTGTTTPGPATAGTGPAPATPGRLPTTKPAGGRTTPAPGQPTTRPPGNPPASTCATDTGNAARVSSPGVGNVTVSIRVCGSAVTSASSSQSRSNWEANSAALPALNSLAVRYYKSDISKIHYSGATLTSNAYQASLRSALSQAGI